MCIYYLGYNATCLPCGTRRYVKQVEIHSPMFDPLRAYLTDKDGIPRPSGCECKRRKWQWRYYKGEGTFRRPCKDCKDKLDRSMNFPSESTAGGPPIVWCRNDFPWVNYPKKWPYPGELPNRLPKKSELLRMYEPREDSGSETEKSQTSTIRQFRLAPEMPEGQEGKVEVHSDSGSENEQGSAEEARDQGEEAGNEGEGAEHEDDVFYESQDEASSEEDDQEHPSLDEMVEDFEYPDRIPERSRGGLVRFGSSWDLSGEGSEADDERQPASESEAEGESEAESMRHGHAY